MVCNLLIVITSLYRLLRTPPTLVEVGKSPIIPTLENSESGPSSNDTSESGTGGSERTTTSEGKASETGGGGEGSGNKDSGSYPKTATPSTSTVIELTELYESDLSFA